MRSKSIYVASIVLSALFTISVAAGQLAGSSSTSSYGSDVLARTEWRKHYPILFPSQEIEWMQQAVSEPTVIKIGDFYFMYVGASSKPGTGDTGLAYTWGDLTKWTLVRSPVLARGKSGEWDAGQAMISFGSVLYDPDDHKIKMLYIGWSGMGDRYKVGYAETSNVLSGDGFIKHPSPVLEFSQASIPHIAVIKDKGLFYAIIEDGTISDPSSFFSLYVSPDMKQWTIVKQKLIGSGALGQWDEKSLEEPYLFKQDNIYALAYRGRNSVGQTSVGLAYSHNLLDWVKHRGNPILLASPDEEGVGGASIISSGSTFHMFYESHTSTIMRAGYATKP